jgi:hypothetical protein
MMTMIPICCSVVEHLRDENVEEFYKTPLHIVIEYECHIMMMMMMINSMES